MIRPKEMVAVSSGSRKRQELPITSAQSRSRRLPGCPPPPHCSQRSCLPVWPAVLFCVVLAPSRSGDAARPVLSYEVRSTGRPVQSVQVIHETGRACCQPARHTRARDAGRGRGGRSGGLALTGDRRPAGGSADSPGTARTCAYNGQYNHVDNLLCTYLKHHTFTH